MQILTKCPSCSAPITATLDDVTESAAALLATKLFCAPCAALRVRLGALAVANPAETPPASQGLPQRQDDGTAGG
jgi:hypothetical protein